MPDDPPPYVLIKMDIEGSEYPVLASMLVKGALCQVSRITLETHPRMCHGSWSCTLTKNLTNIVQIVRQVPGCKPLLISLLDDESYHMDPHPIPAALPGTTK